MLDEKISGPFMPALFGKNYHGFIFGNSYTIWNNHEALGGRTAIRKGKILETPNGVKLEAKTFKVFPLNLMPSSAKFYWVIVPLTLLLWVSTVFTMVFKQYRHLSDYVCPLTGVGIMLVLFGFMKWQGSGNIVFLEKFLHQTFSKYKIVT